jgi:hypothetical protein
MKYCSRLRLVDCGRCRGGHIAAGASTGMFSFQELTLTTVATCTRFLGFLGAGSGGNIADTCGRFR